MEQKKLHVPSQRFSHGPIKLPVQLKPMRSPCTRETRFHPCKSCLPLARKTDRADTVWPLRILRATRRRQIRAFQHMRRVELHNLFLQRLKAGPRPARAVRATALEKAAPPPQPCALRKAERNLWPPRPNQIERFRIDLDTARLPCSGTHRKPCHEPFALSQAVELRAPLPPGASQPSIPPDRRR